MGGSCLPVPKMGLQPTSLRLWVSCSANYVIWVPCYTNALSSANPKLIYSMECDWPKSFKMKSPRIEYFKGKYFHQSLIMNSSEVVVLIPCQKMLSVLQACNFVSMYFLWSTAEFTNMYVPICLYVLQPMDLWHTKASLKTVHVWMGRTFNIQWECFFVIIYHCQWFRKQHKLVKLAIKNYPSHGFGK